MSLATTKANFKQLINDSDNSDNSVIALSGKWGTGKSHMWEQVQKESDNDAIRKALYVSLFGIKDIAQLKLRIVQSAIPDSKTGHVAREVASGAVRQLIKFAKGFNPAFSALDELALLAVPAILRNRMIVIDDIERKHANLDIDEVMGFINEFTQVYSSRILLILNSDQLEGKDTWNKLREKVIDHEIGLETTPGEAFNIALTSIPSDYATHIRKSVEICKISNIRIVQKIIRSVNRLLGGRSDLTEEVLARTVPSTVLMCAVHYQGLEDGPTVEFVMGFNSTSRHLDKEMRRPGSFFQNVPELPPSDKKWGELLDALNINFCGEYELMLLDFLKSGIFDGPRVDAILDGYIAEKDILEVHAQCAHFFELELWHPLTTDEELVVMGSDLASRADLLDPYFATALHDKLADLAEGQPVADAVIAGWLAGFAKKDPPPARPDNYDNKRLHVDIEAAFAQEEARRNPEPSLLDACLAIGTSANWSRMDKRALNNATEASYEETIKSLAGPNLRNFLQTNMVLYSRREHVALAATFELFARACQAICQENALPRLSRAIRKVFRDCGQEHALNVPTAGSAPEAPQAQTIEASADDQAKPS